MSNEQTESNLYERRRGEGSSDEDYAGPENFDDEDWENLSDHDSNDETKNATHPSSKNNLSKRMSKPKSFNKYLLYKNRTEEWNSQKQERYQERPKYQKTDRYSGYNKEDNFNQGGYSQRNKGYNKNDYYDYGNERGSKTFRKDSRNSYKDEGGHYDNREYKNYDNRDYKSYDNRDYKNYDNREYKSYDNRDYKNYDNRDYKTYDKNYENRYDNRYEKTYDNRYGKKGDYQSSPDFKKTETEINPSASTFKPQTNKMDQLYNTNTNYTKKADDKNFAKGKNYGDKQKEEGFTYKGDNRKDRDYKKDYKHSGGNYNRDYDKSSIIINTNSSYKQSSKGGSASNFNKTSKDFDDLKKPVFINSKMQKESETKTEGEIKKSIPIKDMLNLPMNQIEEKVNLSREKYIQQQLGNMSFNAININSLNTINTINTSIGSVEKEKSETNVTVVTNNNTTNQINTSHIASPPQMNNFVPHPYYNMQPPNFYAVPSGYPMGGYPYPVVPNPNMMYNYYANGINLQQAYPTMPMAGVVGNLPNTIPNINHFNRSVQMPTFNQTNVNPTISGNVVSKDEEELNVKDFSDKLNLNAKVYVPKPKPLENKFDMDGANININMTNDPLFKTNSSFHSYQNYN